MSIGLVFLSAIVWVWVLVWVLVTLVIVLVTVLALVNLVPSSTLSTSTIVCTSPDSSICFVAALVLGWVLA